MTELITPSMDFVSFHTHTTYSYGDGFGPVAMHVERVAELGMSALGVSEHGHITSHPALESECRNANIKPIFGVEAYFSLPNTQAKFHITLFAMNEQGYRNLYKIVTQSYREFYQYPTVSWESLVANSEGIAAFSGCSDSLISCTLLGGKSLGPKRDTFSDEDFGLARRRIERFQRVFGENFYLEVQRFPGLPRTCVLNPAFARLSDLTGAPLIATADVHYPYPHQNEMQKILHAARRGSTVAVTEAEWEYSILLTYPESDDQIYDDLIGTGLGMIDAQGAIDQTALLAEKCNVELPKAKPLRFHGVDLTGVDTDEKRLKVTEKLIMQKIREGWQYRVAQRPELENRKKEYSDRVKMEMKTIRDKDFMDYFMVYSELIINAKERGEVIGPARGSAAASLVAYLMRLTEIDPLHPIFNKMVFERFIDPSRSDMPDIDLDFDDEKRINTINDAKRIYGDDNVANISNHTQYKAKNTLKDICRAYGLPEKTFEAIGDRAPERTETDDRVDDSILDVIESFAHDETSVVYELYSNHKKKIDQAIQLEGNERDPGTHAAGFAMSSEPMVDVTAIYTRTRGSGREKSTFKVIPYDKRDAEKLGFLKMDFLGLKTCGMLGKCLEMTGITLDEMYVKFYQVYLDDGNGGIAWTKENREFADKIMAAFQQDDVVGIFQFKGGTTRQACKDVFPTEFAHLADINALSRPGPYYGGQKDAYVKAKAHADLGGDFDTKPSTFTGLSPEGRARKHAWGLVENLTLDELEAYRPVSIHPDFDKHVVDTYGQIVYQEQIMFLLRDLAGFDVAKVLKVRKIIGKKLGEHQFAALWADFRDGCISNGLTENQASHIWGAITTAAGYAFNIAHSFSYSLLAWWSMWFKIDYAPAFFAASLYKVGDGKEDIPKRTQLIKDADDITRGRYIKVLPFDLAHCQKSWSISHDFSDYRNSGAHLVPGFAQIPGIGPATTDDIIKWKDLHAVISPYDPPKWEDLISIKGIGPKTIENLKKFVSLTDPLGVNKTQRQLEEFRAQVARGEFAGTGLPDEDAYYLSTNLPSQKNGVAFVGLVANVVYRDEVEMIRSKTGQTALEIKQGMDSPELTKKCVLFAYDEFGEIALRVSRFQYPKLEAMIKDVKKDHHIVVGVGKTYEGNARSLQLSKIWRLLPDED